MSAHYTVPGMDPADAERVVQTLQGRLTSMIDLQLTLKHVHWNVVGPNFIAVHEMLDPQVDATREMSDSIAERIATLGGEPMGTPGFVVANRTWEDYRLTRATTDEHLAALDVAYSGVIADHREAIEEFDHLDLISQDLLIGHTQRLEMFQWFVRAHLEDGAGKLRHAGATGEAEAARRAAS